MAFEVFNEPAIRTAHQRNSMHGKALSAREQQVAQGIARGRSPSAIANELGLSVKTVSTYRGRILEKLGVRSNAELALWFEQQSRPDYRQALADLIAIVERVYEDSEGRYPAADINCPVCTQGCAPSSSLCVLHAAKRLVKS